MKMIELSKVIRSLGMGSVVWAIVYDSETNQDLLNGCSVEYAYKEFGEREVKRVYAYEDKIVFEI